LDLRNGRDRLHVLIGQAVARVDGEPARTRVGGGARERAQRRVAFPPRLRIAAGVQLDRRHAERGRAVDGPEVGIDEETDADVSGGERRNGGTYAGVRPVQREAALSGDLAATLGDERRLER